MKSEYVKKFEESPNSKIELYTDSLIDLVTVRYLDKLFSRKGRGPFGVGDLYFPGETILHDLNFSFVEKARNDIQREEGKFNYLAHVRQQLRGEYLFGTIMFALSNLGSIPIPLLLKNYLEWVQDPDADALKGYWLTAGFILATFFQYFFGQLSRKAIAYSITRSSTVAKVIYF